VEPGAAATDGVLRLDGPSRADRKRNGEMRWFQIVRRAGHAFLHAPARCVRDCESVSNGLDDPG